MPEYDKKLTDSLGANTYGMKRHGLVLLKTSPKKIADQKKFGELFWGHLDNIGGLVSDGKLVLEGPLGEMIKPIAAASS